ncbi:copper homeostasis protein CutC [Anaerocolumna sedimenticola]|uniref:PF03932 family protein CutC n=1 Tax=Anaerocolumna sedimenticola TaxID=2696063 RepID=A0A6P1TNB4_9FIRM|nr:copper homeostasis protein CutC [Anaerocolumna sedimenticola]QHQ61316.1 copper homeostasis protein CutC [Anaerocolumna sedimenticola]
MVNYTLEACVDSVESALGASKGGANRLELCSNLIIGGTTPSKWLLREIQKYTDIKINVLIRPRFGDFCYSEYEFNIIKEEVQMFKELGANGVALGILKPDGTLNLNQMEILIGLSGNMEVTLHRAFDVCVNPYDALEQAKRLGIRSILTSGQKNTCMEGSSLIKELIEKSQGEIEILVCGGVDASVIKKIGPSTGAKAFHMSGKVSAESIMDFRKEGVCMGLPSIDEYIIWKTDERKIHEARLVLEDI